MKEITLPLQVVLEMIWGHKDKVICEEDIGKRFQECDKEELFSHVQWLEPTESRKVRLAAVWRKQDWITDILCQEKLKRESEIRIEKWNRRKEIVDRIREEIQKRLGIDGGPMAETLVRDCNVNAIRVFTGLEISAEEIESCK